MRKLLIGLSTEILLRFTRHFCFQNHQVKKIILGILLLAPFALRAQSEGEVMFVGYNGEGSDGLAFVTFVPLPNGTTIYFNDNEWNGSPIGGGGAFNAGEGALTWTNNTGNTISAGTVITVLSANNLPTVNLGSVSETTGGFNLSLTADVVYMFVGTSDNTPTLFLSAIANNGFGTLLDNTGLTAGTNATSIGGSEDVMVYSGNTICASSIAACATEVATAANWSTEDTAGDDSNNGFPDFPDDVPVNFYGTVFEAITYYSRQSGAWDDPNSWTTISDGSGGPLAAGIWPASPDNVVILSGHTITVNAVTDNQASGVSANGLGRANVGAFTGSGDQMFYHTGDIIIASGGTLTVSEEFLIEGYTLVENGGTLTVNEDIINLGYLEISTTATFNNTDDLILSGNSITIINNTSTGFDDIYMDWTDATLCGDGVMNLGNGGVDPTVQFFNGATAAQICSTFTITCTTNCGGFSNGPPSGNFISGNTGPGGVGNVNNNQLWLRADDLALAEGAAVTSWADASGNGLTAVSSGTASQDPTFDANSVNTTLPSVSFDGGDYLTLGNTDLNFIPGTDSWSFFIVFNVPSSNNGTFLSKAQTTGGTRQYQYTTDGTNFFTAFMGGNYNQGSITVANAWTIGSATTTTTSFDNYVEGVNDVNGGGVGTATLPGIDVLIGARRGASNADFGFPLTGRIAEIVMYSADVNDAQRIIIENYLAARYDDALTANDVYDMDDNSNGDFDYEVAGIGQSSGTVHTDARGEGIVRVWNPGALADGDFLMWGHDNGSLSGTSTDVDGAVIEERLVRIWRVSESADVGTVSISFDFSSIGNPLGSNLRLLIDRDGDGFSDNDVTPVAGTVSNGIAVFSGIDFQDGDRFTLGNTDASIPLPVELIAFEASVENSRVYLIWTTATETNNDFFTVERSRTSETWETVQIVSGAGNSTNEQNYMVADDRPYQGVSYYRLKQTDFDGTFAYSDVISVTYEGPAHAFLNVFPNPSSGEGVSIQIAGETGIIDEIPVVIYDPLGRPCHRSFTQRNPASALFEKHIRFESSLPPGLYIIKAGPSLALTKRWVVVD